MASSKEVIAVGSSALAPIDPDQTLKASKALLAHIQKATKQSAEPSTKRNLLEDVGDDDVETPIWLTLTTKRYVADKNRLKPGKIPLPHSLHADEAATTICAITADPQRAYKDIIASDAFPADLAKRITRVIDFSKLKAKYGQYEAQRKLFAEHDLFVADDRIINRLPKVLGKTFYKTTQKRPVPVVLQAKRPRVDGKRVGRPKKAAGAGGDGDGDAPAGTNAASAADMAKEIRRALGSALVCLAPTTNTAVRVGYAHWPPEHVAENVAVVAAALVDKWVPHGWRNVKSLYIKGPRTAALPIWQTDELWLDGADVVADGDERAEGPASSEKANVGKKRKSLDGADHAEPPAPKAKKAKTVTAKPQKQWHKDKAKPEGDDGSMEKQVAERKATLRKQKAAAKKAMED